MIHVMSGKGHDPNEAEDGGIFLVLSKAVGG